jgi:hypothetical protein
MLERTDFLLGNGFMIDICAWRLWVDTRLRRPGLAIRRQRVDTGP